MASIIKVDTIQKPDGTAPNVGDLGIDGSIVQIQSRSSSVSNSISSTSWTATDVYVDITPKFSNSKIVITGGVIADTTASGVTLNLTIYRDSTHISGEDDGIANVYSNGGRLIETTSVNFIDSPNTTSSVRYRIYAKRSTSNTARIGRADANSTLTVFEVSQ